MIILNSGRAEGVNYLLSDVQIYNILQEVDRLHMTVKSADALDVPLLRL